jgi:hypothetical protein
MQWCSADPIPGLTVSEFAVLNGSQIVAGNSGTYVSVIMFLTRGLWLGLNPLNLNRTSGVRWQWSVTDFLIQSDTNRELGKEAREQQETLAHLKQSELQMAPENMDEDAWSPPPLPPPYPPPPHTLHHPTSKKLS